MVATPARWFNDKLVTISMIIVIASTFMSSCGSLRPVADDLDPVPAWYNDEFQAYVSGQYMAFADEIRLLCWQQVRGSFHRGDTVYTIMIALVWVRLCEYGETSWSHAFIVGYPGRWSIPWASHSDDAIQYYTAPPTSASIYAVDTWERLFERSQFVEPTILGGAVRARTWKDVFGEEPTREIQTSGNHRKK